MCGAYPALAIRRRNACIPVLYFEDEIVARGAYPVFSRGVETVFCPPVRRAHLNRPAGLPRDKGINAAIAAATRTAAMMMASPTLNLPDIPMRRSLLFCIDFT